MEGQKSNDFCVETKGVCFFCFHENSRFYDSKTPMEREIITQGKRPRNISLKCLSRYLNVNFEKVFKLNIPLQHKNIGGADLIVPLCEECAAVTRNFSKLYSEMELVKMHLHSCVCTIREKIVKADCEQNVSEKYKRKWIMNNPIDAIQAEIVNNLRKETKEKCSSKLETALPRVRLDKYSRKGIYRKLSGETTAKESTLKRSCEIPTSVENAPIPNKRSLAGNDVNPFNATQSHSLPPQNMSNRIISKQPPLQNVHDTRTITQVQICRSVPNVPKNTVVLKPPSTVNSPLLGNTSSTIHLKSPTAQTAPPQPMQALQTLTSSKTYSNQQQQPTLSPSYAPISSNMPTLSSSNIASGSASTTNKRNVLSKSFEKPRQQRPPSSGVEPASHSYDCVHCEEKFSEKSDLRTHVVRSHCEQFFTTLKDRNLSQEEFKSIVYLLFKEVAKSHTIDCSGSTSKNIYNCPYCKLETDTDGDVYAHMFRFHYSDLTSKLLALQKETISMRGGVTTPSAPVVSHNNPHAIHTTTTINPFLCECNMRYASKRTLQFHQKYNCKLTKMKTTPMTSTVQVSNASVTTNFVPPPPISSTSSRAAATFNCAYCGKSFPYYYDHRVHLLTTHRIQEFSKYVSPGVTSEQVDTELKQILQTYRKLPGNDNAGGCLFCTEVFSNVAELQNHILVGHFDVVVFKLRGVTPLQQILVNANGSNHDNLIHTARYTPSSTTVINHAIYEGAAVTSAAASCISPVEQGTVTANSPNCNPAVDLIMSDPLSLDYFELEPESSLFCKEEEHLKMEWLFSFIEEEETHAHVQPQSQQDNEDLKDFNLGNNDSELILP